MSMLRVVCGPADMPAAGYTFTVDSFYADLNRVTGAFLFDPSDVSGFDWGAPSGTDVWFHCRFGSPQSNSAFVDSKNMYWLDFNGNEICHFDLLDGKPTITVTADTTVQGTSVGMVSATVYNFDFHISVTPTTITFKMYMNSLLQDTVTAANTVSGFGVPRSVTIENTDTGSTGLGHFYYSEIAVADEDTRGMRIRELRPQSFGVHREWDGTVSTLTDNDLATGLSTATADRRVSFGLTKLDKIGSGDVINRVVLQTYAQRGETGLAEFNHYFRFADTTVEDSTDIAVATEGAFYIEEFTTNPDTEVAWVPADMEGLQTGIRSRA